MAARPAENRRYGLLNNILSTYYLNGTTERRMLETPEALEMILRNEFNVDLADDHKSIVAGLWQNDRTR